MGQKLLFPQLLDGLCALAKSGTDIDEKENREERRVKIGIGGPKILLMFILLMLIVEAHGTFLSGFFGTLRQNFRGVVGSVVP